MLALGATLVAAAAAAGPKPKPVRPVIGQPVTTAAAAAGDPFGVAFKVTRSDNRKPFTSGAKATWTVVAGGSAVPHVTSFRGGVARVSLTVPEDAASLRITLTVKAGAKSASKSATFPVTPLPALSAGDVSAPEGSQAAPGKLSFAVTLSHASKKTVTVAYASADGTATAPADYAAVSGTLSFAPGETQKTVDVTTVGDLAAEADETLTLKLSNPSNAKLGRDTATGTIANDDVAPKAGHYHGTTTGKDFVDFDVSADLVVTRMNTTVEVFCDRISGQYAVDIGSDRMTVDPATGKFSAGSSNSKSTVDFAGTLQAPDQASGTADATLDFIYQGEHVHCAGSMSWNASWVSAPS